jgi:hypothetical protein
LTNKEGKKLDLLPVECVVDVTKPLIFVLVEALGLVTKEQPMPLPALAAASLMFAVSRMRLDGFPPVLGSG